MKFIYTILNDLKIFLIKKPLILITLILNLFFILIIFYFCFLLSYSTLDRRLETTRRGQTYYISRQEKYLNKEKCRELLNWMDENYKGSSIRLYSKLDKSNKTFDSEEQEFDIPTEYTIVIGSTLFTKKAGFVGQLMNNDDIKNKTNYICVDKYLDEVQSDIFILNKNIDFRENTYEVKGIDTIFYDSVRIAKYCMEDNKNTSNFNISIAGGIIPITTYLKMNYDICYIEVELPNIVDKENDEKIYNWLNNNFKDSIIERPISIEGLDHASLYEEIAIYIGIVFMAVTNIIALFKYWINKNWRKYMIYRLCGIRTHKIYSMIILEALIVVLIACVLSSITFYFINPILANIGINRIISIKQNIFIQLVVIISVFFSINFEAIKVAKNTRLLLRKEE